MKIFLGTKAWLGWPFVCSSQGIQVSLTQLLSTGLTQGRKLVFGRWIVSQKQSASADEHQNLMKSLMKDLKGFAC